MAIERPVISELVHRMRDALEKHLKTDIDPDDLARADDVVLGKYTGKLRGVTLSIHATHPLGYSLGRHNTPAVSAKVGPMGRPWIFPPETLGGSKWMQIYGTVQCRFLLDMTVASAVDIVWTVKTRVAYVINNEADLVGFGADEWGYNLRNLETAVDYGYSGGGGTKAVDAHWCDWVAHISYSRSRRSL